MTYRIRRAELSDVNGVAHLFNEYRMFYEQLADLNGASEYIKERMERNESVYFDRRMGNEYRPER
jgi:hypothetical protein